MAAAGDDEALLLDALLEEASSNTPCEGVLVVDADVVAAPTAVGDTAASRGMAAATATSKLPTHTSQLWSGTAVSRIAAGSHAAAALHMSSALPTDIVASKSRGIGLVQRPPEPAEAVEGLATRRAASEIVLEPRTKIRIHRGTLWLDQLVHVAAQYKFVPISGCVSSAASSGGTSLSAPGLSPCTIGVVISKSEPRVSATSKSASPFGMLRVWSMRGAAGGEAQQREIISVLMCDGAFRQQYSKMDVGTVVLLSGPALEPLKPSTSHGAAVTFRCAEASHMRVLGHAVDLKSCKSINKSSGEQCRNMVNAAEMEYCSFHVGDLKRHLFACASGSNTSRQVPPPQNTATPTPQLGPGGVKRTVVGTPAQLATAAAPNSATVTSSVASRHAAAAPPRSAANNRLYPAGSVLSNSGSGGLGGLRSSESFVAVRRGEVVSSAPGIQRQTEALAPGGVYAGSDHECLHVTGVDRRAAGLLEGAVTSAPGPSLRALGVTGRGREVLAAAIRTADREQQQRAVDNFLSGPNSVVADRKRQRDPPATSDTTPSSGRPPPSREYFAPLDGPSRLDEETVTRRPAGAAGRGGVLAARASAASPMAMMASALVPSVTSRGASTRSVTSAPSMRTTVGQLASTVVSRHDDLREAAELDMLEAKAQKLLEVDRALSLLDSIHEQSVRAIHCRDCNRYSYTKPDRCMSQGHTLVSMETVRRFFCCATCKHRVSLLGDLTPALLLPSCPRCKHPASWEKGSAAPAGYFGIRTDGPEDSQRASGVQDDL